MLLPVGHELFALLKEIPAAVSGLDPISDSVRQRHLGDLSRVVRLFGSPIAKAASEPVDSDIWYPHPPKHRRHRHVRQWRTGSAAGKDMVALPILYALQGADPYAIGQSEFGHKCTKITFNLSPVWSVITPLCYPLENTENGVDCVYFLGHRRLLAGFAGNWADLLTALTGAAEQ